MRDQCKELLAMGHLFPVRQFVKNFFKLQGLIYYSFNNMDDLTSDESGRKIHVALWSMNNLSTICKTFWKSDKKDSFKDVAFWSMSRKDLIRQVVDIDMKHFEQTVNYLYYTLEEGSKLFVQLSDCLYGWFTSSYSDDSIKEMDHFRQIMFPDNPLPRLIYIARQMHFQHEHISNSPLYENQMRSSTDMYTLERIENTRREVLRIFNMHIHSKSLSIVPKEKTLLDGSKKWGVELHYNTDDGICSVIHAKKRRISQTTSDQDKTNPPLKKRRTKNTVAIQHYYKPTQHHKWFTIIKHNGLSCIRFEQDQLNSNRRGKYKSYIYILYNGTFSQAIKPENDYEGLRTYLQSLKTFVADQVNAPAYAPADDEEPKKHKHVLCWGTSVATFVTASKPFLVGKPFAIGKDAN